jgi:cysteine desulfurase / selenocysteine lyase
MTAAEPTRRAHFNHAGTSIPPPEVLDRVIRHLQVEAEIGGYEAAEVVADEVAGVAVALGELLGAEPGDVLAVESATRAWEQVLWAMAISHRWGSGDRIVVDGFAYASSWATLLRLRDAVGVEVAVAPTQSDGSIDPDRVVEVVDERTRLVLATHVPTHVGTVSDVAAVGAVLAGRDLVYAVDLAQSLGQLPIDVGAIGCQMAFAPGRKFLRAPRGTGVLYLAASVADALAPLAVDLTTATTITPDRYQLAPGVARFGLFEHSVALRLGLGAAARHASARGLDRISAEVQDRTGAVVDLVASTPGFELLAPLPLSGIVSVVHERLDPEVVRSRLLAQGVNAWVASVGGSPLDQAQRLARPAVRISPHYLTTDGDLDRLDRALRALI